MRPPPVPIYTALLNHPLCVLTEADRTHLQTHRGFPVEVIDQARYRSARPENAEIVTDLQAQFDRDKLIDSGLLHISGGTVQVNNQLVTPGHVLIPYLCDETTQCYHLRRHKHGFRGVPICFYCAGNADELVLAESEFKAAASYCFGYPAIGIPGISSFAREHFDRLISHLIANAITKVTVVFDNEIKNDPALANFKPDPDKRWDTQYYAALMAQRIEEHGGNIETCVATLPDEWRVDGKIDIDAALAAGHTNEEYGACLASALRVEDYIDSLPEEAQQIVRRKLRAFLLSMRIKRTVHGYEAQSNNPATPGWEPISNFTFDIIAKYETPDSGIVRLVRIKQLAQESDPFRLDAGDMVRPEQFQAAFYRNGTGEAWFRGTKDHLIDIFDLEHNRGPVSVVIEPDHVGKIVGRDMWLFGEGSLINGHVVRPDANGIYWNGVKGYAVPSMPDEKEDHTVSKWTSRVPRPDFSGGAAPIREIAERLYRNFGAEDGGVNAVAAFCWGLSCVYSHEVFDEYGCFPILYMRGLKETGKSTLARWLLRMYGVMHPGYNAPGATLPGICRTLSYYSSIPVFLDECREDIIAGTSKESLFRSAYDRQPVLKASGSSGTAVTALPIRSPIMMAGEHSPRDAALMTRCIFTEFSAKRKGYGTEFDWLDGASRNTFPKVLPWLLSDGPGANDYVAQCDQFRKALQTSGAGIEPRAARNYSILLAIYNLIVDPNDEMKLSGPIMSMAKCSVDDHKEDSDLDRFFEDLPSMRDEGEINPKADYRVEAGKLHIHLRRCWEAWQRRQRDVGKAPNYRTALMQLKQTKYLERSNAVLKLNGVNQKCCVIYLDKNRGCPECLIDFSIPM